MSMSAVIQNGISRTITSYQVRSPQSSCRVHNNLTLSCFNVQKVWGRLQSPRLDLLLWTSVTEVVQHEKMGIRKSKSQRSLLMIWTSYTHMWAISNNVQMNNLKMHLMQCNSTCKNLKNKTADDLFKNQLWADTYEVIKWYFQVTFYSSLHTSRVLDCIQGDLKQNLSRSHVSKSNCFYVDFFRFPFFSLKYILHIPLKWSQLSLKTWRNCTRYFSNSTGSCVTSGLISPFP